MEQEQVGVTLLKEVDFLSRTLEESLKGVFRDTKRVSKDAIDALVGLLTSTDQKIKLAAAKALLEIHVEVASKISDDNLRRLIAQSRENPNKKLLGNEEDEDSRPLVDFSTIRKVE